MIVYAAEFCGCSYEAGFSVISLHEKRKDAEKVMSRHKRAYLGERGRRRRESWELWRVHKYEVKK